MEKIINALAKFGLSTYESKAYITMCSMINGKAIDISEASGIPRSKIYDVLKELNKKGFVEVERTKPLKYTVVTPKVVFEREKEKLEAELAECEEELSELYNQEISKTQAPVWLINTSEKIIAKELEIIERSRSSISMRIGFLLEGEGDELIKAFRRLGEDVSIRILASRECYIDKEKVEIIETRECYIDKEKVEIIETFKKSGLRNLEIIKADIPFVKVLIRDGREMIHTFVQFTGEEKSVIPKTAVGIWNQYNDVCRNYEERFDNQFEKIKDKRQEKMKNIRE